MSVRKQYRTYFFSILWVMVASLVSATPAWAHGEIVYSARYCLPPGSAKTSHYHINKIDPDDTHRVQLTFGRYIKMLQTELMWVGPFWRQTFQPDPSVRGAFYAIMEGKHGYILSWIDPSHRTIQVLTVQGSEAWSPDSSRYCTWIPCFTGQYEYRHGGQEVVVWKSVLAVFDLRTKKVKVLQGGLIDCVGCDWKFGRHIDVN